MLGKKKQSSKGKGESESEEVECLIERYCVDLLHGKRGLPRPGTERPVELFAAVVVVNVTKQTCWDSVPFRNLLYPPLSRVSRLSKP